MIYFAVIIVYMERNYKKPLKVILQLQLRNTLTSQLNKFSPYENKVYLKMFIKILKHIFLYKPFCELKALFIFDAAMTEK